MDSAPAPPPLKLVPRSSNPKRVENPFYVGRRYSLAEGVAIDQARRLCADQDVVVGGYRLAADRAEILAADPDRSPDRLFVWDTDAGAVALHGALAGADPGAGLAANRLQLIMAGLVGPELQDDGAGLALTLTAAFELQWHTDVCAAELGAVELVQSSRTLYFEDGTEQVLCDTSQCEGEVRYSHGDGAAQPIRPVAPRQARGDSGRHPYRVELRQAIPERIDGRPVAGVTVLEKVSSYFLQCEDPQDTANHIWVPLLSPVVWGWSMRVGRRTDGEWGILRRKLFMPTTSDGEMALPVWQACTGQMG